MADMSERYTLPLLQAGQAQKETTHNAALAAIDGLLHLAVESQRLTTPPAAVPNVGAWIVASPAIGVWAGQAGALAFFDSAGWTFVAPRDGCLAYVRDEGVFAVRIAGDWRSDAWPVRSLAIAGRTLLAAAPVAVGSANGGAVVDTQARAALDVLTDALRVMGLVAAR